jgi:hypothetical protein
MKEIKTSYTGGLQGFVKKTTNNEKERTQISKKITYSRFW